MQHVAHRRSDEIAQARQQAQRLREALTDMLAGWRYIRRHHGDLPGVGWDRAQNAAETALAEDPA